MKVLALLGSPRKKGNTETLMAAVAAGVTAAGSEIDIVRLCDLKINPCVGCGGCAKTGRCVIDDDMTPLYDKILATPRIIIVSPIYFYGITSQAKAFVDRCQALWSRKRLLEKSGQWREDPQRKGYLLSVAATRGPRVFEGAVLTAVYAFEAMDMAYGGELLVRGIDHRGEMAKDSATLQEAENCGRAWCR